ncbi:GDSL-type esterase/lipase family protein [Roseivirga echinicomitans]|uniref:Acylhydrolase n=1 Tax=Roseivirga echinicomitans TaxID=296218 RepID=A0A150XNI1_9BACT|nr:GDSL-type esterase/lipase family protein [Roseivirga echinicomitans]KYG80276.1 acylhydrolase [Roseivirga echinicomitans]
MRSLRITLTLIFVCCIAQFASAQDWANLERFRQANSELSMPKSNEHRIVFMGNSITEAWIKIRPEFFKDKPYVNRGISGQTTPQMLIRFKQDVIDLDASVVVLLAGINDIAGNTGPSTIKMITDNIFSMAQLAKVNGIEVIICSVLPAADFPWRPGMNPGPKVIELNGHLKAYAQENDLVYVDYFFAMVDSTNGLRQELGTDGVHPNAAGYLIMEPLLEQGIVKALKKD